MFNRLIAWSLHNRLIVLAITLVLFVAGGYVLQRMPVDVFPEFAPPQVVIQTEAPGMAPQDVEIADHLPARERDQRLARRRPPCAPRPRSGLSTITVVFDCRHRHLPRPATHQRTLPERGRPAARPAPSRRSCCRSPRPSGGW